MKRILSVILSLALLASLLIIPMSVSADTLSEADKAVYTDLISAVDNLKLDFDFAQESNLLVETAYPIGSQVNTGTGLHATDSILNQDKVYANTDDTVPDKIGSKYVSVEENENIINGFWNINTSHLHTIRCQYDTQPVNDSYPNAGTTGLFSLKDSGYLVVYVKTARPFKLGVNFSNNQATPAVAIDVAATDEYKPVIIDMTNINWPSVSSDGYATNNKNWGYFLTVRQMNDGNNTINAENPISFGTVFTIPVDTNVRDFKYIIDAAAKPKPTTAKRFDVNAADFDPAAMIIAAGKITNDGRYTADSWKTLQSAIAAAKNAYYAANPDNVLMYEEIISKVKGLQLDLDSVRASGNLRETAYPVGSQIYNGTPAEISTKDKCVLTTACDITNTDSTLSSTIGPKGVTITGDCKTPTGGVWGLSNAYLNTIRYQYITTPNDSNNYITGTNENSIYRLKDIGYYVVYVKTDRPFKLGVTSHCDYKTLCVTKAVGSTGGEYKPVVIDIALYKDWSAASEEEKQGYATNRKTWGYFLNIMNMSYGANSITTDKPISLGSIYTVPVDANVRDFLYEIECPNGDGSEKVTAKFDITSKDFGMIKKAELIAAAERITNDGRYTVDSWTALQSAITTAKESFLRIAVADKENGVSNIKTLLLSELEDAGTVEEVWKPQHRKQPSNATWVSADDESANVAERIPNYNSELGSFVAKIENGYTHVSIVRDGTDSNGTDSNGGKNPIDVTKYDDMWMYVYNNTENVVQTSQFIVVSTGSDFQDIANLSFPVKKLYRIEIDDVLKEANDAKASKEGWNTNRLQVGIPTPTTGEVYYGTVFGLKPLDTTELAAATTTREIANYYINNVAGKGYTNTANADETMSIIGLPPVIDFKPGEECGSAKLTVTDPDEDLVSVKVNNEERVNDENKESVKAKYEENINKGKYTVVATDAKGNTDTKTFTVVAHSYKYSATGAVITETCDNCSHSATVTLVKDPNEDWVYSATEDKRTSIHSSVAGPLSVKSLPATKFYKVKSDASLEEVNVVDNAGNYVAKLTIGGATAELLFTVLQADLDPQYYAAPQVADKEAGATLSVEPFGANEKGSFTWAEPDAKVKYGSHQYKATFKPNDSNYKTVENIMVTVNGKDETAPSGQITIKANFWDKLHNVLFGWFTNEKETVTITASDAGSGVNKICYYVADSEVTDINEVKWIAYEGAFKIEKDGSNIVYAMVADKAGKVTTINSDSIVLDTIAPVADITDKGTYYGSLTVSVIDNYVDTVTLNGEEVALNADEEFTVSPAEGVQKIVITDMAGNKAEYEVTVLEVKGLDAESEAQGEKVVLTVDSKDKDSVDKTSKDKIDEKLEKGEKIAYFEIDLTKASGGAITNATNVFEIKIPFDFAGKNTNVRVLHNHDGVVRVLDELTARPTGSLEDGKFYADKENNMIYIYTSKFSTFAVTYHTHTVKHVAATVATAEADGNIEYWYCEECGKYFSDAAATKEISKADTVVKYVAPSNGNTGSGSNAPTTGGETENNATVPGGTSPVTGETAMTVVLFAILLGALAVMGISIVKSRKAKSK